MHTKTDQHQLNSASRITETWPNQRNQLDPDAPERRDPNSYSRGVVKERGIGREDAGESGRDFSALVLSWRSLKGWPDSTRGRGKYVLLNDLLTTRFETDAHFTQYWAPDYPWRLLASAHARTQSPPIVWLIVFDIDCAEAHSTGVPAPDDWFERERQKLEGLLLDYPGAFIYRTKGGYRIVCRLQTPHKIMDHEAELEWRLYYVRCCVHLARTHDIVADPTCKAWCWLFRAPHATRDREQGPEERECIGDPSNVGFWTYDPR